LSYFIFILLFLFSFYFCYFHFSLIFLLLLDFFLQYYFFVTKMPGSEITEDILLTINNVTKFMKDSTAVIHLEHRVPYHEKYQMVEKNILSNKTDKQGLQELSSSFYGGFMILLFYHFSVILRFLCDFAIVLPFFANLMIFVRFLGDFSIEAVFLIGSKIL